MPELPEVETIRRTLTPRLCGVIEEVRVYEPRLVQDISASSWERLAAELGEPPVSPRSWERALAGQPSPADLYPVSRASGWLTRLLAGRHWAKPGRRGKYLLLPIVGTAWQLVLHLRMTGQLLIVPGSGGGSQRTHCSLAIRFTAPRTVPVGPPALTYSFILLDARKFARLYLVRPDDWSTYPAGLRQLGPEPLGRQWRPSDWWQSLQGRTGPIKSLLLNQKVVAGVGNIYADEALWRARVHPAWPAGQLSPSQARAVWQAVRQVLREGLAAGGTTIRDYVAADGQEGRYREQLRVYGRTGEPCSRCGTPIARWVLAGRSAHFCPACQPAYDPREEGKSDGSGDRPDRGNCHREIDRDSLPAGAGGHDARCGPAGAAVGTARHRRLPADRRPVRARGGRPRRAATAAGTG